jgi:hypothetical protein
MRYVPINSKGSLVIGKRDQDGAYSQSTHRYDVSNEENFRYNWQREARIIDNRDAMHKRGWAYFRITGEIGGKAVSGLGRIPFVYALSKRFSPWLVLELGNGPRIVDSGAEARVYDEDGKVVTRYKGGSFFKGLGRPWMGLHTVDTVRRDAAGQQIQFETRPGPGSEQVEVELILDQVRLVYTIDMQNDVIERITFSGRAGREGELRFSYLQDVDDPGSEFAQPKAGGFQRSQANPDGVLWLVGLVKDRL